MPQRHAARHHAVLDVGRAHARLRHHEPGQSGAWLLLHGRRLSLRLRLCLEPILSARRDRRAWRRAGDRADRRIPHLPPHLQGRPPRSRAGDVRADLDLQRSGTPDLRTGGALRPRTRLSRRSGQSVRRHFLSGLPIGDHRRRPCRRHPALCAPAPYATWHADPRQRFQSHHGQRARRQCGRSLRFGFRLGRGPCRPRRLDGRADLHRHSRHGRQCADPRLRRHCRRRAWLGRRSLLRRAPHRPDRYARALVPEAAVRLIPRTRRRRQQRAGHRLHAHLHPDGRHPVLPAAGPLPPKSR